MPEESRLDGRLYFKNLPDFDDPKGTGNGTSIVTFMKLASPCVRLPIPRLRMNIKVVVQITNEEESPVFVFDSFKPDRADVEVVAEISSIQPLQEIKMCYHFRQSIQSDLLSWKRMKQFSIVSLYNPPAFSNHRCGLPDYELVLKVYEVDDPSSTPKYYPQHQRSIF